MCLWINDLGEREDESPKVFDDDWKKKKIKTMKNDPVDQTCLWY